MNIKKDNENSKINILLYSKYSELYNYLYSKYITDTSYVYGICNNGKNIVIFQKLDYTNTNEMRENIMDENYAKFRADVLKIILVFNKFFPREGITKSIKIYEKIFNHKYKLSKINNEIYLNSEFNKNINVINGNGIYYFKTFEPAFYSSIKLPSNFTGRIIKYFSNGSVYKNISYKQNYFYGKIYIYYSDKTLRSEEYYRHGLKNGYFIDYYPDSNIHTCGNYIDDMKNGVWKIYNGKLDKEHYYKDNDLIK